MSSIVILDGLKGKFKENKHLSREDLKELLILCTHPDQDIRETALTLLLHPPVPDEISYYRQLMPEVLGNVAKIGDLPPAFIALLCEFVGFLGKLPDVDCLNHHFRRFLRNLPRSSLAKLSDKSLPLRPFLRHVPVKILPWQKRNSLAALRRKWRLLRKLIAAISPLVPVYELTWSDLKPIWHLPGTRCYAARSAPRGRWRLVGRSLLFPPAGTSQPAAKTTGIRKPATSGKVAPSPGLDHRVYFGGFGTGALRYLETLLQWQVKELASVREFVVTTSQNTRRVVLSWHNASLAAAGGWAFENLAGQFPSPALWQEFERAVDTRMEVLQNEQGAFESNLHRIFELWKERLVEPKVVHALWESRAQASFDAGWQGVYKEHVRAAGSILDEETIREVVDGGKYGWHGTLNPCQRKNMDQILSWTNGRQEIWREGLIRLLALLQEGQRLLASGRLAHLVLPWIDKFFISSRRTEDLDYLPLIVRWLEKQGGDPLVLFWEDTSHAQAPSFQLALDELAEEVAFRGIGIFDRLGSARAEALQRICREHGSVRLFALRPHSDEHYPSSFLQLMQNRDYRFFKHYDSSWKDNLCFLYAGTQVLPLLSVQGDVEAFPAWIGVEGRKHSFGAYFRRRLRERILGAKSEHADEFSLRYACWANLC